MMHTPRLLMRALSFEELRLASRGDRAGLGRLLGATVPPDWPGEDLADALPGILGEMARLRGDARWVWAILARESGAAGDDGTGALTLVGDIGFHRPLPEHLGWVARRMAGSTVEIGYIILPPYRGRGYAPEATRALIEHALARPGITRVVLQIAPANAPSLRVAAKLGLREVPPEEEGYRCFERRRGA